MSVCRTEAQRAQNQEIESALQECGFGLWSLLVDILGERRYALLT